MSVCRAILALFACLMLPVTLACAEDNPALYQATAIVTGTDLRQRPTGLAECLAEVLVKVSGQPRLRDDPALGDLAAHAETLVSSFTYVDPRAWFLHHDDQGTYDRSYELTVRFDPAKIDKVLAGLGAAPWQGRPLLLPVVVVRRDSVPYILSAETGRGEEMRATIVRLAGEYGLGVQFPTEADLAAWSVGVIGFPAPLVAPAPGRLQITGSLSWSVQALGWVGIWRVRLNGVEHEWQISGVGFDQAFAEMIRGAVTLAHDTKPP